MPFVADLIKKLFGPKGPTSTKATLAGKPLMMLRPIRWRLAEGVKPVTETFDIHPGDVAYFDDLRKARTPVELVMDIGGDASATKDGSSSPVVVKGLYITRILPGSSHLRASPDGKEKDTIARIEVADRRIWWRDKYTLRRYNMRRAVGSKFRQTYNEEEDELAVIAPDVAYAFYSLKAATGGGFSVTAAAKAIGAIAAAAGDGATGGLGDAVVAWEVLEAVLDNIKASDTLGIADADVLIYPGVLPLAAKTLESFEQDGDSPGELARILRQIPGLQIFIDYDGKVVLKTQMDPLGEVTELDKGGPPLWEGGVTRKVSYSALRADLVVGTYTPEIEVRADYDISGEIPVDDVPKLTPIVRNPWAELTLTSGTKIPQGGYVELTDLIAAINAAAKPIGGLITLSVKLICELNYPGEGWGWISNLAGRTAIADPDDRDWVAMIAAIKRDAFRLFRLNRRFWDRCVSISDRLASGLDREQGIRARAEVRCDYTEFPNHQGRAKVFMGLGPDGFSMDRKVEDYPKGALNDYDQPAITEDSTLSPFEFIIEDPEQAIIRIQPLDDLGGDTDSRMVGLAVNSPTYVPPDGTIAAAVKSVVYGGVSFGNEDEYPHIDPLSIKIATIFTAIPGAPNDRTRLWRVPRTAAEIAAVPGLLPAGTISPDNFGDPRDLRCPPSLEVARFKYSDKDVALINRFFGVDGLWPPGRDEAKHLVINETPEGAAAAVAGSLDSITNAMAAAYYWNMRDRVEGGRTTVLFPKLPMGSISEVVHTVNTNGVATTYVELPSKPPEFDFWAFLPAGDRRILSREVDAQS